MGRGEIGTYGKSWGGPDYTVDENAKVIGGYTPTGPNNWGRWGEDDRRGTANLITPEMVKRAAKLIETGVTYSLALPIDETAPRWPARAPAKHYFMMTGSDGIAGQPYNGSVENVVYNDDYIDMALQGSTQWDGLAHFSWQDCLYNGFWAGSVTSTTGSVEMGIDQMAESFTGRGVLLDVAGHLGVDSLEPGYAIEAGLLDEVAVAEGVEIGTGDIVLVHTGYMEEWWKLETIPEKEGYFAAVPGLGESCVAWLADNDVASVATDTLAVEVMPSEESASRPLPIHHACLVDLGLTLGEFWVLERLAKACREDGRYAFFLTAAPLNIPAACGSPLNPTAIK